MFYYIKGILAYTDRNIAVVEAGGVGYKLSVSMTTQNSLPPLNSPVKLYSHMAVREDDVELFGFYTLEELTAFRLLIGVSGVGPKVAISVLSYLTPEKLSVAVCSEDKKTLGMANGVGAKTAARIVLELKDKMSLPGISADSSNDNVSGGIPSGNCVSDATDALAVLGYNRSEIMTALRGTDVSGMTAEEIIRFAMKRLIK